MNLDFAAVLLLLTLISGLIWLFDSLLFANNRKTRMVIKGKAEELPETPVIVDYARSFFPIFLFVLILRSFIAEPFRIPSASMMPTLLIGDFILVNKYDYGVRLPVWNRKVLNTNNPERGDIIVFRYPVDNSTPYIKRVVGLPGDHIAYYNKTLYINGIAMEQELIGSYHAYGSGIMMDGASHRLEDLQGLEHDILLDGERYSNDIETIVPEHKYFVLGDNRDNSKDSRYWGFVPDSHLVGKAIMIWMNWDMKNGGINWDRIGTMVK